MLASAACIATGALIVWYVYDQIDRWGWGVFPLLCVLTAITLALVGMGFTSRKAPESVVQFVSHVLEFVGNLLG